MSDLDEKALTTAWMRYVRMSMTRAICREDFGEVICAYLAASPAPTVSGEPTCEACFGTGSFQGKFGGPDWPPCPVCSHPTPTRDDVLEEAAKVADEQAKQDRAERLAKAKTAPDECAYHLWAEQTAEGIAAKLRSLKGDKS